MYNNLGNVLRDVGRLAEAVVAYCGAIRLNPELAYVHANLGVALTRLRQSEQAVAAFDEALRLGSSHASTHHNRGEALRDSGRPEEACEAYRRALELDPGRLAAYARLGQLHYRLGRVEQAREVYRAWLERAPDDPVPAHLLEACSVQDDAPPRCPDGFVEKIFDGCSADYDHDLRSLDYRVPRLIESVLADRLGPPRRSYCVLDAGCGTGLCAPVLRPYASRLAGVDLSSGMLGLARRRELYDALTQAELTAFLAGSDSSYDLIVAGDTLEYFGDLGGVFSAASGSLRPQGLFVFTLERSEPESELGYRLHPHGRFSHGGAYVRRALDDAGLALDAQDRAPIRLEAGEPVEGWIVVARKTATP